MIDPLELAQARADIAAYLDNSTATAGVAEITLTKRVPVRGAGGRTTYNETTTGPYPVVVTGAPRQDVRMAPQVEAITTVWLRAAWDLPVNNEDRVTVTYLETGASQQLEVVSVLKRSFTLQQIIQCKEIG